MWLKILFFVFSIAAAAEGNNEDLKSKIDNCNCWNIKRFFLLYFSLEYGERDEEKALPRPDGKS